MCHLFVGAGALVLALLPAVTSPVAAAPVTGPNNHRYEAVLVPAGLSWFDAEKAVEARGCGWYLATLTSKTEDVFVFGLIKKNSNFFIGGNGVWLGAYQKSSRNEPAGNWAWVTGEPFSYTNWALHEPSNRTA